ncbi:unnamed protein product [Tenebrio molitor]|nr:unnamed protein product [Tenebrio molitor]
MHFIKVFVLYGAFILSVKAERIKSVNPDNSPLVEHPELSTSENLHEKGPGDRARVGRFVQPKEFSSSRLGLGKEKKSLIDPDLKKSRNFQRIDRQKMNVFDLKTAILKDCMNLNLKKMKVFD